MKLFVCWSTDLDQDLRAAQMGDDPEEVRHVTASMEAGNRVWESWLLRIGGELVGYQGSTGQAYLPADRLVELPEVCAQYESALTYANVQPRGFVGVGRLLHEATLACDLARKKGSTDPVLYGPEVADELKGVDRDPLAKAQFNASTPSTGEASKVQSGQLSPSAVQPSPPASPGSPPVEAAPQEPQPQPQNPVEQLKQGVVAVLQEARKALPKLEELKETNPEAYEVINGAIQAMVAMGRQLFGGQSVQKSEETEASHDLEKDQPVGHHVMLPIGAARDGKVKVRHSDGKTSWVSVRAGQILSEDGHPISSRQPHGR